MAGVTAAKKLKDEGVHDFVVVEGSDRVRRRKHLFVSLFKPSSKKEPLDITIN